MFDVDRLGTIELLSLAAQTVSEANLPALNDSVKTDELFHDDDMSVGETNCATPGGGSERTTKIEALLSDVRISVDASNGFHSDQSGFHGTPAKQVPFPSNGENFTSTPALKMTSRCAANQQQQPGLRMRQRGHVVIPEGNFCGKCRHKDGNYLGL